ELALLCSCMYLDFLRQVTDRRPKSSFCREQEATTLSSGIFFVQKGGTAGNGLPYQFLLIGSSMDLANTIMVTTRNRIGERKPGFIDELFMRPPVGETEPSILYLRVQ